MNDNKIIAAIYMRTNGVDTNDLYNQLTKCEKYAKENGIKIEGAYTDFQMLLKGKYNAVLVSDRARISRNAVEYALKEQALNHKGMKIIVVGQDVNEQLNQKKVGFNLAEKAKKAIEKAISRIEESENEKSDVMEIAKESMLNDEELKKQFEELEKQEEKNKE